ncbi:MAG TPA: hypothetical protein VIF62_02160 [Labilithrix sp.]|jgi:hypothetical protein
MPDDVHIRSDDVIGALVRGGFTVYRRDPVGTILERGVRAVVVPHARALTWSDLAALRRMAGIGHRELLTLLRPR